MYIDPLIPFLTARLGRIERLLEGLHQEEAGSDRKTVTADGLTDEPQAGERTS